MSTPRGEAQDVLWPPRHLDRAKNRRIDNAITDVWWLAERLEEAGSPVLRRTLTELTAAEQRSRWGEDRDRDAGLRPGDDERDFQTPYGAHLLDGMNEDVRGQLQREISRVFARVRAVNNDLSLILLAKDDSALFPGDAGQRVLQQVCTDFAPRLGRLDVMLAPHHGSQGLPSGGLPAARLCIAQAGAKHAPRWRRNHLGRHAGSGCACLERLTELSVTW